MKLIEELRKPLNGKSYSRPCSSCCYFRWLGLGKRFGVCDKGDHPSDPHVCVRYKRKVVDL